MRHYNKHMECIEETSNFNFYFSNDIKNSLHMEYNFVRQLDSGNQKGKNSHFVFIFFNSE